MRGPIRDMISTATMPTAAEINATEFICQFDESSLNMCWVNGHEKISTYAPADTAINSTFHHVYGLSLIHI